MRGVLGYESLFSGMVSRGAGKPPRHAGDNRATTAGTHLVSEHSISRKRQSAIVALTAFAAVLFMGAAYASVRLPTPKPAAVAASEDIVDEIAETETSDVAAEAADAKAASESTQEETSESTQEETNETAETAIPLPARKPDTVLAAAEAAPDEEEIVAEAREDVILLPKPRPLPINPAERLTPEDAARYARIFELQEDGDWDTANAVIDRLTDLRLMGHVMQQRYMHPTAYTSTYDELAGWLELYADHPGADDIYDLARARKPADRARPDRPRLGRGMAGRLDLDVGYETDEYVSPRKRSRSERRRVSDISRAVTRDASRGYATRALDRLQSAETKKLLDDVEYDILQAEIASSYYFMGVPDKAYELAAASAGRSGSDAPLAGWIAGLSAWKDGEYGKAARYFELVAMSRRASAWTVAAGAYWAARSHLRDRKPNYVSIWLKRAAKYPRTFYGLIAHRALGYRDVRYNWDMPRLTQRHLDALADVPAGARAIALLDAQQPWLADRELRQINANGDAQLQKALLVFAESMKMPALAMSVGSAVSRPDGDLYDAALYPELPWRPEDGYVVDRALICAFIRQESRFNPDVSNRSGASGLMQLMPTTASYVAGEKRKHFSGRSGQRKLLDPMLNLDLGQKYLASLLKNGKVDGNLFKLAVAYNAGPGKLGRWDAKTEYDDDPLLFVESIPAAETRAFVERVLTNYWIYRMRFKQSTPSLDAVAAGQWPAYARQDDKKIRYAADDERRWQ